MTEALSPVSQLLQRNLVQFEGKRLLVAGYLEDNYPLALAEYTTSLALFTTDYSRYRQLQRQASPLQLYFGHQWQQSEAQFDALLLFMPKAKAEAQYLLANLLPHLQAGANIFIAGENRGGINGAEKLLAPYTSGCHKLDSARRCSLIHGQLDHPAPPFELTEWLQDYPLDLGSRQLTVVALPGVFSADGLDEGTAMLLQHLPPLKGRVLDVGCGAGVIGSALCAQYPELEIEMCDINALALESARRTLQANGLTARVFASDMLSDVTGELQHIVTNPPFHAGLKTLYGPTEQLILAAPGKLSPRGSLLLVANRFLKYHPFLLQAFKRVEIVAEDQKFRLYHTFHAG